MTGKRMAGKDGLEVSKKTAGRQYTLTSNNVWESEGPEENQSRTEAATARQNFEENTKVDSDLQRKRSERRGQSAIRQAGLNDDK